MGFVHNHPEQLPRVRRFREYYLPTTRKLLDTAQGPRAIADSANAAEIRRDITAILHTLNRAYDQSCTTPFCRTSAWTFPPRSTRWRPCCARMA